jgi:hypothetical protein
MKTQNPKCETCGKDIPEGKGCRNLRTPPGLFPFCSRECAHEDYWHPNRHSDPCRALTPLDVKAFIYLHFDWWKRLAPCYRDAWLGMAARGWIWYRHSTKGWHALWPTEEGWIRWNFSDEIFSPVPGFPPESSLAHGWERVGSPEGMLERGLPHYASSLEELRALELEVRKYGMEEKYMQALAVAAAQNGETNLVLAGETERSVAVLCIHVCRPEMRTSLNKKA